VGDWLLQNDWMARGKRQGLFTVAGAVHFAVYAAVVLGALRLSNPDHGLSFYAAPGLVVVGTHWAIDATDVVERWMRFYRQSDDRVVRVAVDQTLHLLVLALLAVFLH
jgi:hypothetical protein